MVFYSNSCLISQSVCHIDAMAQDEIIGMQTHI